MADAPRVQDFLRYVQSETPAQSQFLVEEASMILVKRSSEVADIVAS